MKVDALRQQGKETLQSVLKIQKNIDILETTIFGYVKKNLEIEEEEEEKFCSIYKQMIYQCVGDVFSGEKLTSILTRIKENELLWGHECFNKIKAKIEEQDDFIMNPYEVTKGVVECTKCGSDRVFSYSKQTRSSDEGMTVFCQCVKCKAKWTM